MAVQPTYPHDITKTYVWWVDRRQIAIAYHDLDDGNSGYNGEFLSPIVGYDAKIVDTSIAFGDADGAGSTDIITDANNNFLNAGFEVLQEITVSGSASNNGTNNGATEVASNVAVDQWNFDNVSHVQTPTYTSALDFDGTNDYID